MKDVKDFELIRGERQNPGQNRQQKEGVKEKKLREL